MTDQALTTLTALAHDVTATDPAPPGPVYDATKVADQDSRITSIHTRLGDLEKVVADGMRAYTNPVGEIANVGQDIADAKQAVVDVTSTVSDISTTVKSQGDMLTRLEKFAEKFGMHWFS